LLRVRVHRSCRPARRRDRSINDATSGFESKLQKLLNSISSPNAELVGRVLVDPIEQLAGQSDRYARLVGEKGFASHGKHLENLNSDNPATMFATMFVKNNRPKLIAE